MDESDDITGGSTLEVTYDLKDTGLSYKTATNLAVFPENTPADVKLCAELLSLGSDLDQRFIFKANPDGKRGSAAKHPFPTPVSIYDALTRYVDMRGSLRKKLLSDLSGHCTDEVEKMR